MKDFVHIPPKAYHPLKEHPYYADFERHICRTLPKAHRHVISQLEYLRFHHRPIRAVITCKPQVAPALESSTGDTPADPLQELLLQYSRWIIDHVFRDHDDPFDPVICCIGRRMDHTRYMIRRGLQYKVMNANVVNWTRRAIPGSLYNPDSLRGYTFDHALVFDCGKMRLRTQTILRNHQRLYNTLNPALPAHERSLHIIYSDRLTAEHLPHMLHIEAEYVAPPEAPKTAAAAPGVRRRGLQRLEDPVVFTNIYTIEALTNFARYKSDAALAELYRIPIEKVPELLAKIPRDGPF